MMVNKELGESIALINGILRGINDKLWGGNEGSKKAVPIVKTGGSISDIVIGGENASEDFGYKDPICGTLSVIGSVSTAVGMALGNIEYTKYLTTITFRYRSIWYHCKNYGPVWGCTVATGSKLKKVITFKLKNPQP